MNATGQTVAVATPDGLVTHVMLQFATIVIYEVEHAQLQMYALAIKVGKVSHVRSQFVDYRVKMAEFVSNRTNVNVKLDSMATNVNHSKTTDYSVPTPHTF